MTSSKWSFGLCVNIIQAVTRRRVQLIGKLGGDERVPPPRSGDRGARAQATGAVPYRIG